MPSTMIHFMVARKYNIDPEPMFLLGNLAPDAVSKDTTRIYKDKIHFRVPNREHLLKEFANNIDLSDMFCKGYLLHLYSDFWWDKEHYNRYKEEHNDQHWFENYRNEITLAGSYIFHNYSWGREIWKPVLKVSKIEKTISEGPDSKAVIDYALQVYNWYKENSVGPSLYFTQEIIDAYVCKITDSFDKWIDSPF